MRRTPPARARWSALRGSLPGIFLSLAFGPVACAGAPAEAAPCPPAASPPVVAAPVDPLAGLDESLDSLRREWHAPGLAVAIVYRDRTIYSRGFGLADLEGERPVDADTVFQVASNTKPMFATLVAQLADEGKLDLDAHVVERMPSFLLHDPIATREMRVADLLAHDSGLATFAGDLMWIGSQLDSRQVLTRMHHIEPGFAFRDGFGYSNLMFLVAGELVLLATGETWDRLLAQRVFTPLGMSRTSVGVEALARVDNVATPYMERDGEPLALPHFSFDTVGPAGAVNSSVADLAKWARLVLAEGRFAGASVVTPEAIATTFTPHNFTRRSPLADDTGRGHFRAYGLGWYLSDYRGHLVVEHGGGAPGTTSLTFLVPEEELGVIVMTNSETPIAEIAARSIVDRFLGGEPFDWSARARRRIQEREAGAVAPAPPAGTPAPPTRLDGYAGVYENPALGRAKVRLEGATLHLHLPDHGGLHCPLAPITAELFSCTWADPALLDSPIRFTLGRRGARELSFRVRPQFIDPVEYTFTRAR